MNHNRSKDPFEGSCPYHKDCWEGLAAGPALQARWSIAGQELPSEHPGWELEVEYIAQAMQSIILTLSPQKIILGGGVMNHPGLIEKVRISARNFLNGYVDSPAIYEGIDQFIVAPELGNRAGVLGAIALAKLS